MEGLLLLPPSAALTPVSFQHDHSFFNGKSAPGLQIIMAGLPSDVELSRLISELAIDEKLQMLAGKNVWETVGIERLGVPSLKVVTASIVP
jgi:hypothetical protein